MGTRRFQNYRGNIVLRAHETEDGILVARIGNQGGRNSFGRNANRSRSVEMRNISGDKLIVPTVEMTLEADKFRTAGMGAREPQRHHGRPAQFLFVVAAKMGSPRHLALDGGYDFRPSMPEQQRPMAAVVIGVLVAVDVPFSAPFSVRDV